MRGRVFSENGINWVSEALVIEKCGVTQGYLKNRARPLYRKSLPEDHQSLRILPDTGKSWRYAKFFDTFYYDLNRIPDRAPTKYRSKLPPVEELMKKERSRDEVIEDLCQGLEMAINHDWHDFIRYYANDNNRQQLARGAACLHYLASEYHKADDPRALVMDALRAVKMMDAPYMPSSYRLMRERLEAYINDTEVSELVFLPRAGNQNALRMDDPDIFAWMVKLRSMKQNFSNAHIIRVIQNLCGMFEKDCPSSSWFYDQLSDEKMKFITSSRFGAKGRFANKFTSYIPISNALFAGDCWQIDGTRVNLVPHIGPDGQMRSLFMVVLRDVYSGDILGTWYGAAENRWAYIHVLKMAVEATGKLPYEVITDRFPGHQSKEWQNVTERMRQLGTKFTITHKATGKAQIERWIGTLQSVFMIRSKYFYGEGFGSTREYATPAVEHMTEVNKMARQEGFDFDMAWMEATRIIETYRDTPYSAYRRGSRALDKSPRELQLESEKPNMIDVDLWQQVQIFGYEKQVTIRRDGFIKTEIMKLEYMYRVLDFDVIQNHTNVRMMYELDDLSTVHLFTPDEDMDYLGEVKEERAIQMYGPNAELGRMSEMQAVLRELQEFRENAKNEVIDAGYSEFDLLAGSTLKKDDNESNVTRYMVAKAKEWQNHGQPRLPEPNPFDSDEEERISVNVLDQI